MTAPVSERCPHCGVRMGLHYDEYPMHREYPPFDDPCATYICVNPDCHVESEDGGES